MAKRSNGRRSNYALRQLNNSLDAMIDEHGWAVLSVFGDRQTGTPGFSYTVGLTAKTQPEVVVFGLNPTDAKFILNDVARRLLEGKAPRNERLPALLASGYEPVLVEASRQRGQQFVRAAVSRYGDVVTVLQLVLPDRENKLPWEDGYSAGMNEIQPVISD